ncbi:hypothetical protein TSMEX_010543 [Taenia solium]|eukprot:TsM_000125500 transcript=TsM_000125500 gene=TsM_000125500
MLGEMWVRFIAIMFVLVEQKSRAWDTLPLDCLLTLPPTASIVVYGGNGKGNVDVEADPWEATEAAMNAFELVVVVVVVVVMASCGVAIIRPIDAAASFLAHCGLFICAAHKQRSFVLGGLMKY